MSSYISSSVKNNGINKNNRSYTKHVGWTIQELKDHLEKMFSLPENLTVDGNIWMNWDNYGKYNADLWNDRDVNTWTWQIDHIVPKSTFKYTDMSDELFKKCWSLCNLRPYSAKQNNIDGGTRVRHNQIDI